MRGYITTHRGKRKSTSEQQHKLLHVICADHTHIIDGRRIRHSWDAADMGKRCGKPCKQCGYRRRRKR